MPCNVDQSGQKMLQEDMEKKSKDLQYVLSALATAFRFNQLQDILVRYFIGQ